MGCSREEETESTSRARSPKRRFGTTLGIAMGLWVIAAGLSLAEIERYASAPGEAPEPPASWPRKAGLRLETDRPTLLMVVHPRCPCSRASLAELAGLMAELDGRVKAQVLFVEPPGRERAWSESKLWQMAGDIPGVERVRDPGGTMAARFHLATSGHTVLYGADGALRFSGGITAARGHEGDNAGRAAITALATGGADDGARTSVFGCPLFDRAWRTRLGGGFAALSLSDRDRVEGDA